MNPDHVDVVLHDGTGDIVIFVGRDTAAALAVLLHVVEDNPTARLSPHLKPLMAVLDEKLVGYKGKKIV